MQTLHIYDYEYDQIEVGVNWISAKKDKNNAQLFVVVETVYANDQ